MNNKTYTYLNELMKRSCVELKSTRVKTHIDYSTLQDEIHKLVTKRNTNKFQLFQRLVKTHFYNAQLGQKWLTFNYAVDSLIGE